jgi:hypothetical protein
MTTQHIGTDDRRSVQLRLSVMQYVFAGVFSLLAVAFWVFQVAQHAQFKEIAESQYLQRVPLPAPRGVVVDRHGTVLHELCFQSMYALIEGRPVQFAWSTMVTQAAVNALIGVAAFQIVESAPGLKQRREARRNTFASRRF